VATQAHLLNPQLVEHILQDLVVVDHVIVVLGVEVNLQLAVNVSAGADRL
jgi:hypothetical protein